MIYVVIVVSMLEVIKKIISFLPFVLLIGTQIVNDFITGISLPD